MANDAYEIDIREIFRIIKKHALACCIVALVAGIAAFLIASFAIKKEYTSSVTLYVNSNASSTSVNLNDINASQKLADTYIVILKNGTIYSNLSERLDGKYTDVQLKNMISLSVVDSTEIICITVVADSPEEAARICGEFAEITPQELEAVVLGGIVRVIGEPSIDYNPTYPNVLAVTALAVIAGGGLTAAVYVFSSLLDTKIRSEKDITKRYTAAVLGIVPEREAAYEQINKVQNGSSLSKKKTDISNHSAVISATTPFSIIEAYNKIYANIRFSVSQDTSRMVVVTSSVPGEFKSTTSVNLAVSIAQSGARVLLVDSDMRKPTLHNLVRVPNECGLSNVLADFCDIEDALYTNVKPNLDFLPSGLIPPNPITLLSSERTKKLFSALGAEYDYVVIDSPPLNLVSDAALLSQYATGVLMVIRAGKCSNTSVDAAMESLNIAKANLLGIIMTGGHIDEHSYSSYGYGYSYTQKERADAAVGTMNNN